MRLRRGDTGEVAQGFYKVTDGTLIMTDEHGEALRDDNSGQRITVRVEPGRDAVAVSKWMPLPLPRREARRDG
jgi:hypothetical protein